MKRLFTFTLVFVLVVGLSAFACKPSSSNNNGTPTTPGNSNTTQSETTYVTQLKTTNEVPAIGGPEGSASGLATIKLKTTKDANNVIISATADFQVSLSGFPAGSSVTMAHIHPGNATSIGGISVNTGISSGDVPLTGGAGSFTRNGVNVSAEVAQGMLNNPGNYYFNVHSAMNNGGVVRGQVDGSGAPVDPTKPPDDPTDPYPYMSVAKHH